MQQKYRHHCAFEERWEDRHWNLWWSPTDGADGPASFNKIALYRINKLVVWEKKNRSKWSHCLWNESFNISLETWGCCTVTVQFRKWAFFVLPRPRLRSLADLFLTKHVRRWKLPRKKLFVLLIHFSFSLYGCYLFPGVHAYTRLLF